MKNITKGRWSFRPEQSSFGTSYSVYPKGERSHWSVKAWLYPASDGKSYVITIANCPLDARPSLDEAIDWVVHYLDLAHPAPAYVGQRFEVTS